jgi:hypothetical protein
LESEPIDKHSMSKSAVPADPADPADYDVHGPFSRPVEYDVCGEFAEIVKDVLSQSVPADNELVQVTPVYTTPAATPVYTTPAAPVYTTQAAPIYTKPAATPVYTTQAAPIYTTPAATVYATPAAPIYTTHAVTTPATPVYTTQAATKPAATNRSASPPRLYTENGKYKTVMQYLIGTFCNSIDEKIDKTKKCEGCGAVYNKKNCHACEIVALKYKI